MIRVCLVRGKYLNNFEGQNYLFKNKNIRLTAVSSLFPLHSNFPFPVKKFISPADLPFFTLGIKYLANRLFGDSQILIGLEKLADRFDIFHTADPHYYFSYQLARLKQKKLIKKLIITSWETIPFNNESTYRKKQIKYFTLSHADLFICYTEKAKRVLIQEGVNQNKISVVRLGVDLNKFRIKNSELRIKNRTIVVLFVGRLIEEKGVLDLYEAFKNIKRETLNMKHFLQLKIVGKGKLKNSLINLIKEDGFEKEVKIEDKSYEEMAKIYQEADIFVLPSKKTRTWEEQYGMVLFEAMASGLPIVAYNTGAISEIIGNAGILIRDGDIKSLFTSINQLIVVNGLRSKLGKIGRQRAKRYFDAKKTAKKVEEIYKEITKS